MEQRWDLRPVGVVRSTVTDTHAMPVNGVPAAVEVYEEYAPALAELETQHPRLGDRLAGSGPAGHVADRRPGPRPGGGQRGVFSLRHHVGLTRWGSPRPA